MTQKPFIWEYVSRKWKALCWGVNSTPVSASASLTRCGNQLSVYQWMNRQRRGGITSMGCYSAIKKKETDIYNNCRTWGYYLKLSKSEKVLHYFTYVYNTKQTKTLIEKKKMRLFVVIEVGVGELDEAGQKIQASCYKYWDVIYNIMTTVITAWGKYIWILLLDSETTWPPGMDGSPR